MSGHVRISNSVIKVKLFSNIRIPRMSLNIDYSIINYLSQQLNELKQSSKNSQVFYTFLIDTSISMNVPFRFQLKWIRSRRRRVCGPGVPVLIER